MPPENLVGRTVAGYRLVTYVGEGGTATVYRGEHPEKGHAAVKVLRSRLSQDPVAIKRFLREAEFGTRVKHPSVVQTFDFGQAEGLYYLALEWAETARDRVRLAQAEKRASELEKRLSEGEAKLQAARTLIEQTAAQRARAEAELSELERAEKAPPPAPQPKPKPAGKAKATPE